MSSMYGSRGATGANLGNKIPKGHELGRIEQFTPEQWDIFRQFSSLLGPDSFLSKLAGGSPEAFEQMEAPALKQFSALQGGLSSRFSGMGGQGSLGSRHSSGFQNTMNQASSDFAQNLQARRMELQSQAMRDIGDLSSSFLSQRPYDQFLVEKQKKPSFLQSILGENGQNIGAILQLASMFI